MSGCCRRWLLSPKLCQPDKYTVAASSQHRERGFILLPNVLQLIGIPGPCLSTVNLSNCHSGSQTFIQQGSFFPRWGTTLCSSSAAQGILSERKGPSMLGDSSPSSTPPHAAQQREGDTQLHHGIMVIAQLRALRHNHQLRTSQLQTNLSLKT